MCGGEQTGVASDSTQYAGIFVLYFALNDSFAKRAVIHGWRNGSTPGVRWIERRMHHTEWTKDFALAETVERFIGNFFQRRTQDNEADVAVRSACARISSQRCDDGCMQKRVSRLSVQKEFFVGGQTGRVGQQHAHSYFRAPGIVCGELRNDGCNRQVQIQ